MAKARKIGHVNRRKGTFCWVDERGDVWERDPPRKRKKNTSKKKSKKKKRR